MDGYMELRKSSIYEALPHILPPMFGRIAENLESLNHGNYDVEKIHRLRVAVRRTRSAFSFFRPVIKEEEYERLVLVLRELQRETALLRETDVMLAQMKECFAWNLPYENCGNDLQAYVSADNDAERIRELRLLSLPEWKKSLKEAEKSLENPAYFDEEAARQEFGRYAEKRLKGWIKKAADVCPEEGGDDAEIHEFRIRLKKIRYCIEEFQEVFGKDMKKSCRQLLVPVKSLADYAGFIHDCVLNTAYINAKQGEFEEGKAFLEAGFFLEWQNWQKSKLEKPAKKTKKQFIRLADEL